MKSYIISIFVALLIFASSTSFAYTDAAIDGTMNRASQLTKPVIDSTKGMVENEFGTKTILRWDAYVNPNVKIKCYHLILFFDSFEDCIKECEKQKIKCKIEKNSSRSMVIELCPYNKEGYDKKCTQNFCEDTYVYISLNPTKIKPIIEYFYDAADSASKNKYGVKVSPLLVYVIGVGEGFIYRLRDIYCGETDETEPLVSWGGEEGLGLDYIYDEIATLKTGDFIREDFNEGDEYEYYLGYFGAKKLSAATFANVKYGIEALAARVAWTKYLFLKDAKELGILTDSLTEDQINFWTYYYYHIGFGSGKKVLTRYTKNGILNDYNFIRAKPGEAIMHGCNARHNSIMRTSTAKFIRELGVFE